MLAILSIDPPDATECERFWSFKNTGGFVAAPDVRMGVRASGCTAHASSPPPSPCPQLALVADKCALSNEECEEVALELPSSLVLALSLIPEVLASWSVSCRWRFGLAIIRENSWSASAALMVLGSRPYCCLQNVEVE
jgi:hypothetical protein